jgi:hypothetical protein
VTTDDIPKAWRSALASVQLTFPDAVIAGGCLRDREQGVKVKDIDIFISTTNPGSYGAGSIVSRLERDGWADVALNGDESYGRDVMARGITAVVDLKYPGCPPLQLIAMKQFKLEEIDFGICQIMFDGKRIVRLPDYHYDLAAKQFRIIPKMTDALFVRSLGRWARLKEKYPAWTLHLGSRADDAPFVPPRTVRHVQHGPNMQQVSKLGPMTDGIHPPFATGGYVRNLGPHDINALLTAPGDYVMPKVVADRLAKETTAQVLKHHVMTNTVTVRVDANAAVPAAKIMADMIEAQKRMQEEMALRRAARV